MNKYQYITLLASLLPSITSANFDTFGEDALQGEITQSSEETIEVEYDAQQEVLEVEYDAQQEVLEQEAILSEVASESVKADAPIPSPKNKSKQIEKGKTVGFRKTGSSRLIASVPIYVNTQPRDAQVRIMNIKPRYYHGMKLKPGLYDIEVSKPGYRTQRFTKYITDKQSSINVDLNKIGSLQCKQFQKKQSGSWKSTSGSQLQFIDYLEGVTVSEIYSSAMQFVKSQNNMFDLESGSSGDYAYISFNTSPASEEEIDSNAKVKVNRARAIKEIIGIEKASTGSGVNLITHLEFPYKLAPSSEDEYYCKMIKAL
jgi:uncharacterized protein YuzE